MNFDQLKEGDSIYYATFGENSFVQEHKIIRVRKYGCLVFTVEDYGQFHVVSEKTTIQEAQMGCISTNAKQAAEWVERKLKKEIKNAEKDVRSKITALADFRKKYKAILG